MKSETSQFEIEQELQESKEKIEKEEREGLSRMLVPHQLGSLGEDEAAQPSISKEEDLWWPSFD